MRCNPERVFLEFVSCRADLCSTAVLVGDAASRSEVKLGQVVTFGNSEQGLPAQDGLLGWATIAVRRGFLERRRREMTAAEVCIVVRSRRIDESLDAWTCSSRPVLSSSIKRAVMRRIPPRRYLRNGASPVKRTRRRSSVGLVAISRWVRAPGGRGKRSSRLAGSDQVGDKTSPPCLVRSA